MKEYEFTLILSGLTEFTDDQVNRLFAAGCDDATMVSREGMAMVHFDREAQSLEEAIRSAVANVQSVGFKVAKLEIGADELATV